MTIGTHQILIRAWHFSKQAGHTALFFASLPGSNTEYPNGHNAAVVQNTKRVSLQHVRRLVIISTLRHLPFLLENL